MSAAVERWHTEPLDPIVVPSSEELSIRDLAHLVDTQSDQPLYSSIQNASTSLENTEAERMWMRELMNLFDSHMHAVFGITHLKAWGFDHVLRTEYVAAYPNTDADTLKHMTIYVLMGRLLTYKEIVLELRDASTYEHNMYGLDLELLLRPSEKRPIWGTDCFGGTAFHKHPRYMTGLNPGNPNATYLVQYTPTWSDRLDPSNH